MKTFDRRTLLRGAAAVAAACTVGRPPATPTPGPDRVKELAASMSVRDLAGQVMSIAFHGPRITSHVERMIREHHIGGVILFAENADSASAIRGLADDVARIAAEAKVPPLFVAIDHEGGSIVRVGRGITPIPGAMALAATPDPRRSVERAAELGAKELLAAGVTWNFAPVADVNDEPRNPIIGNRAFGSDPARVAELVATSVRVHTVSRLLSCAKHFPGHGSATVDSHTGLPELAHDRARLDRVELVPFRAAIDVSVPAIMTAHIRLPAVDPSAVPATLSRVVLDGLLRKELGFQGLVVTDDLEMDALKEIGEARAGVRAVQAGADYLLFRFDEDAQREGHRLLVEAATSGELPVERLRASAERVLAAKARFGVLDGAPRPSVDADANARTALELARAGVTLLRNEGAIPLRGRLLVVSARNPDLAVIAGSPALGDVVKRKRADAEVRVVARRPTDAEIGEVVALARSADVVVFGSVDLAGNPEQVRLVRELRALRPLALVSLRSPYDVLAVPEVPAYLCVYHGREPGLQAAAEILLGELRPIGKLPVEIPGLFRLGAGLT
jgi:beta-N-acetylhexosaminidase